MNVVSFYRFVGVERTEQLRADLQALCERERLLGTILVAAEGVNGTLAGEAGSPWEKARVAAVADLGLTPRQVAVLTLVAEGLTAVAIGHRLHVSSRTVEQHLHHIYERLRVHDRASAVRRACLAGLIQDGVPEPQISAALSRSKVKASSSRGLVR